MSPCCAALALTCRVDAPRRRRLLFARRRDVAAAAPIRLLRRRAFEPPLVRIASEYERDDAREYEQFRSTYAQIAAMRRAAQRESPHLSA